jgi:hypothetical protein
MTIPVFEEDTTENSVLDENNTFLNEINDTDKTTTH